MTKTKKITLDKILAPAPKIPATAKGLPHTKNDFYIMPEYCKRYPTDSMGPEINPAATINGCVDVLNKCQNFYEYTAGDSVIRERIFKMISEATGVEYSDICDQWLKSVNHSYSREDCLFY